MMMMMMIIIISSSHFSKLGIVFTPIYLLTLSSTANLG
jgi:hypothetical protein